MLRTNNPGQSWLDPGLTWRAPYAADECAWSGPQRRWVPGLIDGEFRAVRQADRGQ
jgi:hypothetical protein